jgi:hypothetical protein
MQDDIAQLTQELAEQFRLFRMAHKPQTPYPIKLWEKAVEIAGQVGVSRTSRALRVDYMSLKRRLRPGQPPERRQLATFIEWLPPLPGVIVDCTVDVISQSGARMTLKMKEVAPSALGLLLRDFVGQP